MNEIFEILKYQMIVYNHQPYAPDENFDNFSQIHCDVGSDEISVTFDKTNNNVCSIDVTKLVNGVKKDYVWIDPDYNEYFEPEKYQVQTDTKEDIMNKVLAIVNGTDFDESVVLSVELPKDVIYSLMKEAHEKDITLNQLVQQIFQSFIDGNIEDDTIIF